MKRLLISIAVVALAFGSLIMANNLFSVVMSYIAIFFGGLSLGTSVALIFVKDR